MKTTQFNILLTKLGEEAVYNSILDQATNEMLTEHFYYRFLCDSDDKFIRFFQRNLNKYKKQYNNYLRIENTTFDPMVSRYLEKKYTDISTVNEKNTIGVVENANNTLNTTITEAKTGTISDECKQGSDRTQKLTDVKNTSSTATQDRKNTGTVTDVDAKNNTSNTTTTNETDSTNTTTSSENNRIIASDMPQANVSSSTTTPIGSVNWQYASNMQDSAKNTNSSDVLDSTNKISALTTDEETNNSTQTQNLLEDTNTTLNEDVNNTANLTENNTINLTNTQTQNLKDNITNATENLNNVKKDTTADNSTTSNFEHKEIFTGRDDSPQRMLEAAREYIVNTNAFAWLTSKLDTCFMSDFFYDEEGCI